MSVFTLYPIKFDIYYLNNKCIRQLYHIKQQTFNTNETPQLTNITLIVRAIQIPTIFTNEIIATFFLLKYLTGQKPCISFFKISSSFKKRAFSVFILVSLNPTKSLLFFCNFLARISYILTERDFFLANDLLFSKRFILTLNNFSFLRLVETHPIFFKWSKSMEVHLKFKQKYSFFKDINYYMSLLKCNHTLFN